MENRFKLSFVDFIFKAFILVVCTIVFFDWFIFKYWFFFWVFVEGIVMLKYQFDHFSFLAEC